MSAELKERAARAALEVVESGMRLGIGTGSTAEPFIRALADKVLAGMRVIGVPTSQRSAKLCAELGIPLSTLEETPELDLTVDGADEIDPQLRLIKGGGGSLLREKIVAAASARMVVIADISKKVETLGAFPLPIEVDQFGLGATRRAVEKAASGLGLSGEIVLRQRSDKVFVTDGGHYILDASFGRIPDPEGLSCALHEIPGVVEHGLFIGLARQAFIASSDGVEAIVSPR
ncbi:ribose-5-phosphate isomerase RpiA [Consotaella salsifontis]|uniref:Ribose-5-phosphate isomerase A n=1 Tax=Consotaella salsifontis TaxID=1365950 RepID=A0A1T4P9X5_9HYPH|nr:ribose-5-phosphate isomerase RpiA [Consotaella salsifontis]SJZ88259.1 ribose-5-phosphate isomerase [Consotaella salsifontis]